MDLKKESEFSEIKAVHQCVYCSSFLKGRGKLLDCLHLICQNCLSNSSNTIGVECKCKVVTKNGNLLEFSIFPGLSHYTMCSKKMCYELANKTCNHCKCLFCESCSQVHSSTTEDHITIMKNRELNICTQCNVKVIEVYCSNCSIMLCSHCQFKTHRSHLFQHISLIGKQTISNLSFHRSDFKSKKKYFENCLNETTHHAQLLENKKKMAVQHIDKTMQLLHEQIYQRSMELKKEIENSFLEMDKKLNDNKKAILESMQKNIYYDKLIQTVFNHNSILDFVKLSTPFMDKLHIAKRKILEIPIDMKTFKSTLEFSSDGTLINGLLAIKAVGKITSSMIMQPGNQNSFSPPSNGQSDSLEIQVSSRQMVNNPIPNGLMECDNEVEVIQNYIPPKTCECCNQWIDPYDSYFLCSTCSRTYHNQCHIPQLSEDMISFFGNECTLCRDISTYMRRLNAKDLEYRNNPIGKSERKILERILMEIYCKNTDSEYFHSCPSNDLYPDYARRIAYPISLHDIKRSLQSDKSYTLNLGITNLKQVFSNAMKYYPRSDPCHIAAKFLQYYLNTLIDKFIPNLSSYYITY